MRVLLKAASLAVLVLALAVPATAEHGGDIHPVARTEQTYFHCAGPVKVQNVYAVQGTYPSWDTTAPAQSAQQGAGCGYYENIFSGNAAVTSTWAGTFTGNLDSLTVELHRLLPMAGVTTTLIVGVVEIDGIEVFNGDITLQPVESESGASNMSKFSLRNLKFMTEDGEGTTERTVRISIDSYNEQQSAWVWDTTEVPSGITFNPETFAGSVIAN